MSKQFWAIIIVILLAVGGAVVINGKKTDTGQAGTLSNNIRGDATSGVTLVEYADFQCSACESYYPLIESVYSKYSSQISFQFVNFPLTQLHSNAFAASRAAQAAAKQGKFWEMYNMLYTSSNWSSWTTSKSPTTFFQQYASSIGLNVDQFNTDFASKEINDTVSADLSAATKLNLTGTPTYFLDGQEIKTPPTDLDAWSKLIDAAITAKTGKAPTTTDQTTADQQVSD